MERDGKGVHIFIDPAAVYGLKTKLKNKKRASKYGVRTLHLTILVMLVYCYTDLATDCCLYVKTKEEMSLSYKKLAKIDQ